MPLFQKAVFHTTVAHLRDLPLDAAREIAFAGRSNAGKSSAINTLANHTRLAYVSKTPGRTQHLNYFTLDMTNGRGFIALAAVILGGWSPWGALAAALLFGAAEGVQVQGQSTPGFPISSDLMVAMPYIVRHR